MKRGMARDYSWNNAAVQYEQVFDWAFVDPPYVKWVKEKEGQVESPGKKIPDFGWQLFV